jgi:hypothetical protein
LAVVGVVGFFLFGRYTAPVRTPSGAKPLELAQQQVPKRLVDLRPFEAFRGRAPGPPPGPVVLQRENQVLVVLLPIGSGEGQYVLRLLDASGGTRAETTGNAMIKNYVTTVEAPVDLRSLPPGRFTLIVRRSEELASTPYPVEIR